MSEGKGHGSAWSPGWWEIHGEKVLLFLLGGADRWMSISGPAVACVSPTCQTWTVMVKMCMRTMGWAPGRHGLSSAPTLGRCVPPPAPGLV